MSVWVIIAMAENVAVPVGYYFSKEACVKAAQEAVMIVGENVVAGGQLFTCVPVDGVLK